MYFVDVEVHWLCLIITLIVIIVMLIILFLSIWFVQTFFKISSLHLASCFTCDELLKSIVVYSII